MKLLVMGLGFVGLTTALGFADQGVQVYGYDVSPRQREKIAAGEVPFWERGLPEALERNLGQGFNILADLERLDEEISAVFFCVGTPCLEDGRADLRCLKAAVRSISGKIGKECLLVVKSTVPPGTTKREILPYVRGLGCENPVAVNPEFLREGYCWSDFTNPDRIVCGVDGPGAELLEKLYTPFHAPIHFVTPNTAEFIKYLSNCLLANLISFSNEMAAIAEAAGDIAIGESFRILREDNRLEGAGIAHYIYPGCGYGGYCLPKDTRALIQNAQKNGFHPGMLDETVRLNDRMPRLTAQKILRGAAETSDKIGILGLSFKPNSDDVRDSPAAKIIKELLAAGCQEIWAYDPVSNRNFEEAYPLPIHYCTSKEELCSICSTVAVVTIWPEFRGIDQTYPKITWIDCRYFL